MRKLMVVLVVMLAILIIATPAFATSPTINDGGNRLVGTQNSDGGWGWPLTGGSAQNTIGPIGMGLAQAYLVTGDSTQLAALLKVGTFLLAKTNTFSPPDGYLAVILDQIFGVTTYTAYVKANFYDKLAAGTYTRSGDATLYNTDSYVQFIRNRRINDQANMAAWDVGMGLVAAAAIGADTAPWVAGVEAEINELDGTKPYDVIGLAGAVYGLAFAGVNFDPTAGQHASANSLLDLATILASYQILPSGGFAWNSAYVIPNDNNEVVQETAYAILALKQIGGFDSVVSSAQQYLRDAQLNTGGWEDYVGDPDGENNEITGEALWALKPGTSPAAPVPELPAVALFGMGLAGLGTFFIIKRRRAMLSAR